MKVKMKKTFKGREAYRPIISVDKDTTRLSSGEYTLIEETNTGKFLVDLDSGKTYFVPNQEYEKCVLPVKPKYKKEREPKRKIYVTKY